MIFRPLAKFIYFKLMGWTFDGSFDPSIKKYIIIVVPHTSNWDFLVGVLARSILQIQDAKYLGKSSLFKWPYGWLFRALGGYPVDRAKSNNLVDAVVKIFDSKDEFAVALAPEGTRSKVESLKSGFYYIALKASVPIYKVGFDYARKMVVVDQPFIPSGDIDAEMPEILHFFKGITGKNPELGL